MYNFLAVVGLMVLNTASVVVKTTAVVVTLGSIVAAVDSVSKCVKAVHEIKVVHEYSYSKEESEKAQ